jgi:arsenate reductase
VADGTGGFSHKITSAAKCGVQRKLFDVETSMITIYHNPHCSKSREALAMVEQFAAQRDLELDVVDYLKNPPSIAQLATLLQQLGTSARDMVRENEAEYATLNLAQADDAALLTAITQHPRLLQRPIVSYAGRALIGRPPERLASMLR